MKFLKGLPSKFYLVFFANFLCGFTPITALYAILFEKSLGFNIQTISYVFSYWAAAYIVFEIPTGALADYFSRKLMVGLGLILRGIGFFIWAMWPSLTGVLIGFTLWAFSIACWSGSEEALMHDELRAVGREDDYSRVSGMRESIFLVGAVLGFAAASLLQGRGFSYLSAFSGFSAVMSGLVYLLFKENPRQRHATYLKTLKESIKAFATSRKLISLGVLLIIIFQIIGVLEEYQPRVFALLGASLSLVAILSACVSLVSAVFLSRADRIAKSNVSLLAAAVLALSVLFFVGLYSPQWVGIVLTALFFVGFLVLRVVFVQYVTQHASEKEKATVGSIPGFFGGIIGIGLYSLVGFGAAHTGQQFAFGMFAVSLSVLFVGYFVYAKKYLN